MSAVEVFRQFLEGREGKGSAMTPIQWIFATLIAGVVGAGRVGLPSPLLDILMGLIVATLLFFFVTYGIWMKIDRDALRSERYSLRKLELQRGLVGDSAAGLRRVRKTRPEQQAAGAEEGRA